MKKVRIGLIGVGGICNGVHIPGYLKCEECEIVAICDINENALEKIEAFKKSMLEVVEGVE
jgi:predicted dehydrogenase